MMDNQDFNLEEIEVNLSEVNAAIEMRDALMRLSENADFKKIIHEKYFKEEASRLVLLRASPSFSSEEDQKALLKSIDAIGEFRMFLNTIDQIGKQMIKSKNDLEESRQELLAE